MANLQVKNVPETLRRKIHARAKREGRTVRDYVLDLVRRDVEDAAFYERLAKRQPVVLDRGSAEIVADVRRERERELDG